MLGRHPIRTLGRIVITFATLAVATAGVNAQREKIIVDQDARGPASTDMNAILMLAQSPKVDVLGITLVAGDQWVKEEAAHTLRALELAKRTDIPVMLGASTPLINTREESEAWEKQYGEFGFKGAWTPKWYHAQDVVPDLKEGAPTSKISAENAVEFIIKTVHKYPGEVTLWAGGPLTNIALAIRMDPEVVSLSKQLVLMGSGFNVGSGGIHEVNGRREFNWWFDPEAVRIVMSAPWKNITITPVDISVKTKLSKELQARIGAVHTPLTDYLEKYSDTGYPMWDEISAAAFLDPSFITKEEKLYVNIDIDHGPSYGQTIFVGMDTKVPGWWKLATVQFDLDSQKFYDMYVQLMTAPPGSGKVKDGTN